MKNFVLWIYSLEFCHERSGFGLWALVYELELVYRVAAIYI